MSIILSPSTILLLHVTWFCVVFLCSPECHRYNKYDGSSQCIATSVLAWSPHNQLSRFYGTASFKLSGINPEDIDESPAHPRRNNYGVANDVQETRRRFLNAATMNVCLVGAATVAPSFAATTESSSSQQLATATKYISGKSPQVPGETNKPDKSTKGTRKDPDFLRSIADCKNECQSTPGPDGLARSKEDCLSECQDICCKTYEQ